MINTKTTFTTSIIFLILSLILIFNFYIHKQDQLDMKELEKLVEEEITTGN